MPRFMRLALPAALAAAAVVLFDAVAWFAVPQRLTGFAPSYRKTQFLARRGGHPALARSDARHYFQPDEATGFDIRPGARVMHEFGEVPNEIFANDLGCFDRNGAATLRAAGEYHYFGGDSFTWGFADYDSKFATVWEKATGKVAAKCGVSHTGQAHQLAKLERVAAAVGRMPSTVFVGFYVNDPANDAAFPHTTVIEGFVVDTVYVRGGELVRADPIELRKVVAGSLAELERPLTAIERAKAVVWVFSLSANLLDQAWLKLQRTLAPLAAPPAASPTPARAGVAAAARPTSRFGENLYYWYDTRTMKTSYRGDPKTAANRAAIERWAAHAREHGYKLVFLLFPPNDAHDDPELFGQVRAFLEARGIEHLDFARLFRAEGVKAEQLYWRTNGHWNPDGNRAVGRLLAQRYP